MKVLVQRFTSIVLLSIGFLSSGSFVLADDNHHSDLKISPNEQLPLQDLRNFTEVFERIRSAYVEEVDDKTLFDYAINGMLSSLDPHSAYLQADAFSDLRENTSGKFGGLGIEVGMDNGLIRVISPIDDTPAERAGIRAGDLIVSLDGDPVMGLSLAEAVEKMRGEPGSTIELEVRRGNDKDLLSFVIERAEIKVASVRTDMLHDNIGYVRITQFQEKTGRELNKALTKWQSSGNIDGVILDLRNNPGGVLDAAVEVVDAFISEGVIVYTKGRNPQAEMEYSATPTTAAAELPVIILINGGSASASEIVAGALQDHKRAVIVGTQSFGKGSVQSVLPLNENSAVKLTTARYFTPNDRSIQAQGIIPDIYVEQSEVTPFEQRFYKEADLPGHLSNPTEKSKEDEANTASDEQADKDLLNKDFQLYEAHTLLRGMSILSAAKKATIEVEE